LQQKMRPREHWQLYDERSEAWLTKDQAKYPTDEVRTWLQAEHEVLGQLKTAVYREYCDWDLRIQDLRGTATISYLLAEFQESRTLARVLQLTAHDQIMAGRYDDAVETLRQGYQLAQDIGRPPLLISGLIGTAIGQLMHNELTFLIERSGENYYWALAALPDPLVDMRLAMQCEMNLPNMLFPYLKDAQAADRSPEEWRRLTVQCIAEMGSLQGGRPNVKGWEAELLAAGLMAKLYPVAKEQLVAQGMDRAKVEAMPVGQVVAIHTSRVTEHAYHEVFKVALLSTAEGLRRMPDVMKGLEKEIIRPDAVLSGRAGIPLASLLLPAEQNVLVAGARAERNLAALKVIEALRMHAAASGGLPATLADVTIVPVPENPASGEAFPYQYDAASGTATLDLPRIFGGPASRRDAVRYVIRLRK